MSLLSTLTTDDTIANEKDSVGGGSRVLDSALYTMKVALAYIGKSAGGAISMNLLLKTEDGRELKQTLWMTSGTTKGCKNFYEDKDGNKQYLPGFIHANSLCLLTVGKEIAQLETEQKVIPLYNAEAKSEVPTKVDMLMDLLGKDILAGVIKQTVDKTKKDDAGNYVPTGETREENEIDKFFRARDRMTTAEIRAQAETAAFADTWAAKWTGQVKDKSGKTAAAGTAGAPKKAANPAVSSKPTTSLFA